MIAIEIDCHSFNSGMGPVSSPSRNGSPQTFSATQQSSAQFSSRRHGHGNSANCGACNYPKQRKKRTSHLSRIHTVAQLTPVVSLARIENQRHSDEGGCYVPLASSQLRAALDLRLYSTASRKRMDRTTPCMYILRACGPIRVVISLQSSSHSSSVLRRRPSRDEVASSAFLGKQAVLSSLIILLHSVHSVGRLCVALLMQRLRTVGGL